jgi:hypothetical protein
LAEFFGYFKALLSRAFALPMQNQEAQRLISFSVLFLVECQKQHLLDVERERAAMREARERRDEPGDDGSNVDLDESRETLVDAGQSGVEPDDDDDPGIHELIEVLFGPWIVSPGVCTA